MPPLPATPTISTQPEDRGQIGPKSEFQREPISKYDISTRSRGPGRLSGRQSSLMVKSNHVPESICVAWPKSLPRNGQNLCIKGEVRSASRSYIIRLNPTECSHLTTTTPVRHWFLVSRLSTPASAEAWEFLTR